MERACNERTPQEIPSWNNSKSNGLTGSKEVSRPGRSFHHPRTVAAPGGGQAVPRPLCGQRAARAGPGGSGHPLPRPPPLRPSSPPPAARSRPHLPAAAILGMSDTSPPHETCHNNTSSRPQEGLASPKARLGPLREQQADTLDTQGDSGEGAASQLQADDRDAGLRSQPGALPVRPPICDRSLIASSIATPRVSHP